MDGSYFSDIPTDDPVGDTAAPRDGYARENDAKASPQELALVTKLQKRAESWTAFHKPAFKRMREDMRLVRRGAIDGWPEANYVANLIGRHINQRVSALYAKNPKAVFRSRKRKEFKIWDETPDTLVMANTMVQQAMMMFQQLSAAGDPMAMMAGPQMMLQQPGMQDAVALLEDVQQGMQRKQLIRNLGETLEYLYAYYTGDQMPVNLKIELKAAVRRAATTGVAYAKLGWQRAYGPSLDVSSRMSDVTYRLNHLRALAAQAQDDPFEEDSAEIMELQASLQALTQQPEVVVREGLTFDFPDSTAVIPDPMTKRLRGFVGARAIIVNHFMTCEEVYDLYNVDLKGEYTGYGMSGRPTKAARGDPMNNAENNDQNDRRGRQPPDEDDLVCVREHYDKATGLKYEVADGYSRFLRPAGPPEVVVEEFWPVYALTFNEVEDENQLFPPSDARLLMHQQHEHNLSRQGKREHRRAARPRWVAAKGLFDEEDKNNLDQLDAHEVAEVNALSAGDKIQDKLQQVPSSGVDPNLYDTNETDTDFQLVGGASEAAFGVAGKATATGDSIAEAARAGQNGSNVDDLDDFLSILARAGGQICLREASYERVMVIVGPGAVWPEFTAQDIADEVFLTTEAGSSGRPNQAMEIQNIEKLAPFLLQMPGIKPAWLLKQLIQRLDDRLDPTEAYVEGLPSIAMMNAPAGGAQAGAQAQMGPGGPPSAQGPAGAGNAPTPQGGPPGTAAPMGNNQV